MKPSATINGKPVTFDAIYTETKKGPADLIDDCGRLVVTITKDTPVGVAAAIGDYFETLDKAREYLPNQTASKLRG